MRGAPRCNCHDRGMTDSAARTPAGGVALAFAIADSARTEDFELAVGVEVHDPAAKSNAFVQWSRVPGCALVVLEVGVQDEPALAAIRNLGFERDQDHPHLYMHPAPERLCGASDGDVTRLLVELVTLVGGHRSNRFTAYP